MGLQTGSLALVSWLKEYRVFLHFLTGAVLLGYGLAELRATFKQDNLSAVSIQPGAKQDLIAVFLQVVSIGLSNPMTILGYMSLMMEIAGDVQSAQLVIAVMCGLTLASVLWRVFLGTCLITMRQRFGLVLSRKITGALPIVFFLLWYLGMVACLAFVFI